MDEYKWLMHTCLLPQMSNVHKDTTLGMFVGIKKDPACSNFFTVQNKFTLELQHLTENWCQVGKHHTGWNSVGIMGEKFLHT